VTDLDCPTSLLPSGFRPHRSTNQRRALRRLVCSRIACCDHQVHHPQLEDGSCVSLLVRPHLLSEEREAHPHPPCGSFVAFAASERVDPRSRRFRRLPELDSTRPRPCSPDRLSESSPSLESPMPFTSLSTTSETSSSSTRIDPLPEDRRETPTDRLEAGIRTVETGGRRGGSQGRLESTSAVRECRLSRSSSPTISWDPVSLCPA
jgi:hypothetical protein